MLDLQGMDTIAARLRSSFGLNRERIAVELPSHGIRLTYGMLERAAMERMRRLDGTAHPIVLHVAKSPAYYEFAVGAFLTGRSWCPVDIVNPPSRVAQIAESLGPCIVLTDDVARASELAEMGVAAFDVDATNVDNAGVVSPPEPPTARSGRYFISTSGSTGTPKLVEVRHDATVPFVEWAVPFYAVDESTRWAQFSSMGFDLSLVDLLTVLCGGGTLVAICTMAERARPGRFVDAHAITHWHSVPTMIPALLRGGAALSSLLLLTFCGEPLPYAACRDLRGRVPAARLVNTYGPTEGTLFCTFHEVGAHELTSHAGGSVPIGGAIPGWRLVPVDDDGEVRLVVVGEHLAEGYHGTESAAFTRMEVDGAQQAAFDTGDYVRATERGWVFSHRRDAMVKVDGNRVDLGDVTDACVRIGLANPVALLVDGAIVVLVEDHEADSPRAIAQLRELLPVYAVPTRVVGVGEFPRTANGKVDRGALTRTLGAAG